MKKLLVFLPLVAVLGLAGCGDKENEEEGAGEHLPYNEAQAQANMETLATDGYEISFTTTDDNGEKESSTLGTKDGFFWHYAGESKDLVYANDTTTQDYVWEDNIFKKDGEPTVFPANLNPGKIMLATYSGVFYQANYYDSSDGFHKVKDLTFAGRSATEYRFHEGVVGIVELTIEVIIDKATGITLYWDVSGHAYTTGESGSASYEVTSFKTGAQVVIPAHEA